MGFHRPSQRLLRDDRERVGVVDDNEAVDAFTRRTMTDKFGHRLPDTVNTTILLGRQPEYPFRVRDGDAMRRVVGG